MSDLLLDTHTMLWFFWDDPLLSPTSTMQQWSRTCRLITKTRSIVCW